MSAREDGQEDTVGPSLEAASGVTGELFRSIDWTQTSFGPLPGWPAELTTLVRLLQTSRHPMMLFWGIDLRIIYNDAFIPFLGSRHPAAMGQPAAQVWADAWPVVGKQIEQVMGGQPIWRENMLVPIERGGVLTDVWWTYSYSPIFDGAGAVRGVFVVATETTREVLLRRATEEARREAEQAREELRGIFLQAPLPMCILIGPEHRFTLANDRYVALVGRPVEGKAMREAFNETEVGHYLPILDRVLQSGEPVLITEAPLALPDEDGRIGERFIDAGYHPYRDKKGAPAGVLVVIQDVTAAVTARRQLERQALERAEMLSREQELRQAAEASGRARDEFLAMLGHELRNPLAPIATAVQLMKLRGGDTHLAERQVLERQVTHLSRLVDDLLDVSRIARGKIELLRGEVELTDVIGKAVEMARPLLDRRAHELKVTLPEESLRVDGDPVRLAQVLSNLLTNAARYTQLAGHVRVSGSREGDEAVVRVADDGPGINPELLPRIFELFVQGPRSIERAEGGLGLGLALVKSFVQLHGGAVSARNLPAGGSEFTIRLPALARESAELLQARTPPRAVMASRRRRVLLVDDNVDAAGLLADLLQGMGHEVRIAHDGPSALAVSGFDPEVALLDIGLPGMDGYELARRLRARPGGAQLRLVAVTGYGQAEDQERSRAAGFDAHLIKPIELRALSAQLA